jgi:hypothetical protein
MKLSEEAVFRWVLIVVAAAASVIALTRPLVDHRLHHGLYSLDRKHR